MAFLYVRPDESFMFGTVTGTVDTDYDADWLLDGRSSRPVRRTSGGLTLTATALAARTVGLIALVNHNITGTVGITGDITATIPAATLGQDGLYLNSYVAVTPTSATSVVMAASGTPAVVGELYAGQVRQLERQLRVEPAFELSDPFEWQGEWQGFAPYDPGVADPRRLTGDTIVSGTGLDEIHAWYRSTRRGTRPTLIVPIDSINDPWMVTFRYTWQPHLMRTGDSAGSLHRVAFEFLEIPRLRWPA